MSHSILLREFPLDNLEPIAQAVSQACQIPVVDARNKLRKGWGFLERNVTGDQAEQTVAMLKAHGVDALTVANDELEHPDDPSLLKGFQPDNEGFVPQLQPAPASPRRIEWKDVRVVAAGGLSEEIVRREAGGSDPQLGKMAIGLGLFMVTGVPMGIFGGGKKESAKQVKSSRLIMFGRLVTVVGEQLAFNPDHFDFSGLGNLKQLNASLNFRAFITVLSQLTPARFNFGARLLLGQQALTQANYQSLHDIESEMLWLMNAPVA